VKDQLNQMEKRNKALQEEMAAKEASLIAEIKGKEEKNLELELELSNREKRIETLENKLNFYLMNGQGKQQASVEGGEPMSLVLAVDSDC
jgi:hypothetical protein